MSEVPWVYVRSSIAEVTLSGKWLKSLLTLAPALLEGQVAATHIQDTIVKIPELEGESEATSWNTETEKYHVRRVREEVSLGLHCLSLSGPLGLTFFSGGKKEAKVDNPLHQCCGMLSGWLIQVLPHEDHWWNLGLDYWGSPRDREEWGLQQLALRPW